MKTSVALCTYNGKRYLAHQLDSILCQTHPVDEIVVCDDESSDGTMEILESYRQKHPQVLKVHKNAINLGGRKNFEKCFGLCTGDVIFFCDQDDVWHKDKVKKTMAWFHEDEDCWCIATDANLVDENGKGLQKSFWESFVFHIRELGPIARSGLCDFVIRHHNMVAGAMMAVKKEAKPFICPFQFPQGIWHDEWMTIVLSSMGKMKLVDERLVYYRVHSEQQAGVGKDSADLASWTNKLKSKERLQADPNFYLSHAWNTYEKVRRLKEAVPFLELGEMEKSMLLRLQDAKQNFLKRQGLLPRKAKLVKWYMESRFVTSWKDVVTM